jgi:hypothetical protein
MTRLTLLSLLGAAAAALLAWRLGGARGAGVLAGYLLGAGASVGGVLWQRRVLARRPERAFAALAAAFLGKLALLFACALCIRFVDALAERVDGRAFLVAFGVGVVLVLPLGAWEVVRCASPPARVPRPLGKGGA